MLTEPREQHDVSTVLLVPKLYYFLPLLLALCVYGRHISMALKAICNWTPFAELAGSEVALRCVAEHPHISVRHFGRFRGELFGGGGEQHHCNQVCDTFLTILSYLIDCNTVETVYRVTGCRVNPDIG